MTVHERDPYQHTYADLGRSRSYGDELIDGSACVREPPAPSQSHQMVVMELGAQLTAALRGKPSRVYAAPFDVRLPKAVEEDDLIDTVVQPDVLIVCDPRKIDEHGMRGAPDWLAEVLSPRTARHDRFVKLPAYERAGVREVWLINPVERTVAIYRLEAGRYGHATVLQLKRKTQLTAVPGVAIDWDLVLAKFC